ncbi:MAG: malto-oligosyltrehalose synthase [bacterium]
MKIPRATYRIQFNNSFGFQTAKSIISYLKNLGISDIYASPIFESIKGSTHGYDVINPGKLNPELGTESDFDMLIKELQDAGLGWIQDIVPNHMAFDGQNDILMDVLENGKNSQYFNFFDIDWEHPYESIRGRLLAPFLGRFYAECLQDGEIFLGYDEDGLHIRYYNLMFPLRVDSYYKVFSHNIENLDAMLGEGNTDSIKLAGIINMFKLPSDTVQTAPADQKEENNQNTQKSGENQKTSNGKADTEWTGIKYAKKMLWELYNINSGVKRYVEKTILDFNGEKGNLESFQLLDNLLSEQLFRLSFWKVANEEINYRRFFSINGLISLRVEDENVSSYTHSLIKKYVKEGKINGLRVDHIDGLYDPEGYLRWLSEITDNTYTVVEKILDNGEQIPSSWAVQGSTGYDFLNKLNGIFCNIKNKRKFTYEYAKFTELRMLYTELVAEKKRLVIGKHMAGNIDNLARDIKRISGKDKFGIDVTLYGLRRALVEFMTMFQVYRTYINAQSYSDNDQRYIREALEKAIMSNPGLIYEFRFIERFFALGLDKNLDKNEKNEWLKFVMSFQQFTGPLMAKGFEDTTFYVYNRLISLNEVGGNPGEFGVSLRDFHKFNMDRSARFPNSFSATSTHDTKRGEDVRTRINVLSEIPKEWRNNLRLWSKLNNKKKKNVNGREVPDENDEYFLYQTLLGTFPFSEDDYESYVERVKQYIVKAVREAKVHTAWLKPDEGYEEAYLDFVTEILKKSEDNQFLKEFMPLQKKVAHFGIINSLAQLLIKITAPGVPDFYQGTEVWELNLVDPDNRRQVDFINRIGILDELEKKQNENLDNLLAELINTREDGRIKLFLMHRLLNERKENSELFLHGSYVPLEVSGQLKDHVIAFGRQCQDKWAVIIAPRFLTSVLQVGGLPLGDEFWTDTAVHMPSEIKLLKNTITQKNIQIESIIKVGSILNQFPVSLLIS